MNLIKCLTEDYKRITDYYKYVIDNSPMMKEYARWIYGQHPTDDTIRKYIDDGHMYYSTKNNVIMAAVALMPFQGEEYHAVSWNSILKDDEVCVPHLFCVNPDFQRQGVARSVMNDIIAFSREANKRAVRLDTLCCNIPAQRFYESIGFNRIGVQNWYANNTGWIDFILYEYLIDIE